MLGRCDVESRVAIEKADRHQREPGVLDRHHGPVLRPWHVGYAERMPHDDVGVLGVPVLLRVNRQAGRTGVQVGERAGIGVQLIVRIGRNPEIVAREPRPFPVQRAWADVQGALAWGISL